MTDQDVAPAPDRAFQCEACGGVSEYAPGTYALRCPYCKHEQDITPIPRQVTEHPIEELAKLRRASAPSRVKVYTCPGCHAVTESDTLSDKCQFCATPLVADAAGTERVVPEAVLPFGVSRGGPGRAGEVGEVPLVRARRAEEGHRGGDLPGQLPAALDVRRADLHRVLRSAR